LFRTIENGVPLIRCSNNGLTCWIDAQGRLHDVFRDTHGTVYGTGFLLAEIPIAASRQRDLTFYTRHGDWFGWGCVAIGGILFICRMIRVLAWLRRHSAGVRAANL